MRQPLLVLVLLLLCSRATAESADVVGAYIPAYHKLLYDSYNVVVFGDTSLARAAVRGPLAVQGRAELSDFDIAATGSCDKDARSLAVGGALTARMGAINNGYAVAGRRSKIDHTVKFTCTNRVEQYDPIRNGDIEFDPMRRKVLRETGDMCTTKPTGEVEIVNSTLRFMPGEPGFSCYTFFKVKAVDLRLVQKWEYAGDDAFRNIVIVVSGLKMDFRDFIMEGFNSRRTLVVFCAVYGSFGMYNAKMAGSLLAPSSSFTAMNSLVNGSLIVGSLRGSLVTLNPSYVTC